MLRRAEVGDEEEVARIHVRSWQVGYRGLIDEQFLAGLQPAEWAKRYTFDGTGDDSLLTTLAVEAGVIRGFVTSGMFRDEVLPPSGEICAIYVDPTWWGSGIGQSLLVSARATLRARGFVDAYLWVLSGNARADRFYRGDGWLLDGTRRTVTVHGIEVDELRYHSQLR